MFIINSDNWGWCYNCSFEFELNWQVVLYLLTALIVYVGMLYIGFCKNK